MTTLLVALLLSGCSKPDHVQSLSGFAQGTTWNISFWQPGGADTTVLQQRVDTELARLDQMLSNYRSDSVIEKFNADTTSDAVSVGTEIVLLTQLVRKVSEASQGCYDLTTKPLFDLWGFNGDQLTPPDHALLQQKISQVGFRKLEIMPPDRLRKAQPELRVGLSSIAQGYSVGRIAAVLEAAGIKNYLVEIGGELQTRGRKPDGSYWRIAVERPIPGERMVQTALTIKRDAPMAVITSGTYRHYFEVQGKRYSHILDARTGKPVEHNTVSVTVLNDDPALADAWATALLCLGEEVGTRVADQEGIAALLISDNGSELVESVTAAWRTLKDIEVQ